MKVKELIQLLHKVNPEALIVVDGYEGGYDTPSATDMIRISGPYKREWYYGSYDNAIKDELLNVDAFILRR
jgi:hypothetical protein